MAELLKNYFTPALIERLANTTKKHYAPFDTKGFTNSVLSKKWEELELKERMLHIAQRLHTFLPESYPEQIAILTPVAPEFKGMFGMIFPTYVETYGLDDYTTSIQAMEDFTIHSTSEFAIRPFLVRYPQTIKQLYKWSKSNNHHVRRLSSEGCRPLLPWAMKLHNYVADPTPILPILEHLRNDPEDYVYRSVANNLNDISKNHPNLVLDLAEKWINESKTTHWVCKHALRTLLKQGNQRAMRLFGFGAVDGIVVEHFKIAKNSIAIGKNTSLDIRLKNKKEKAKYRIEYAIGYLKKNGSHSEKVFQIKETEMEAGKAIEVTKKLDFKDLTTRKHYAGKHYICLKINGHTQNRLEFELT